MSLTTPAHERTAGFYRFAVGSRKQALSPQMVQDDFMNNCAVRTTLSGVLGAGLGVAFGVFMGTMDTAASSPYADLQHLTVSALPVATQISFVQASHAVLMARMSSNDTGTLFWQGPNVNMAAEQQTARQVFRQMLISTRQRSWWASSSSGISGSCHHATT